MSIDANKNLVQRYQEAHNTNNLDALGAIVATDLITHSQMPGLPPGLEGGKMVHQRTVMAIPDFRADIEDLIAEGDKVVARLTFRGTHTGGDFMGIPPSGNSFAFSATSIFRIADGKIAEWWVTWDNVTVLQQLGHMPSG